MDKEELLDIIFKLEEWHKNKVEQLNHIINMPEDGIIKFEGKDGETVDLPKEDMKVFKIGISVALEVLGKFPVKIESPDYDWSDSKNLKE